MSWLKNNLKISPLLDFLNVFFSVQKAHDISKCIQISSFKNTCHFHFLPCATSNMILWGTVITLFILCNKNILYSYKPMLVLDSLILYIDVCIVLVHQLPLYKEHIAERVVEQIFIPRNSLSARRSRGWQWNFMG